MPPLAAGAGPGDDTPGNAPAAETDEPTVVSRPVDDEATVVSRPVDDEATTLLSPPVAAPAAVDDEPVAEPRSLDGGSTMRLQPPFFAPGTTRTPRTTPAAGSSAPRPDPADESPEAAAPDDASDSWDDAEADRWDGTTADSTTAETERWDNAGNEADRWDSTPAEAERWDGADSEQSRWESSDSEQSRWDSSDSEQSRWDGAESEHWQDSPAWSAGTPAGDHAPERWPDEPDDDAPERWPGDDDSAERSDAGRDTSERWQDDVARAAVASDEADARDGGSVGSPDVVTGPGDDAASAVPEKPAAGRRLSSAGALIWVLLALLGFTLVVQLQSNDEDAGLATARQEDLVGILSDLEARDQRLQQEINALEESQRQLTSGVAGREAALAEAGKRADELGLLSGTLPARGPGLKISIDPRGQPIKASAILNAVQELRGAGGEVMEIIGDNGVAVRIVASSYFVDAAGGQVLVDGQQLSGPYTLWVIGVPSTMQTALQIPGGVVASVSQAGGNVTMEQRSTVEVAALRQPTSLQYARPVS